MNFKDTIVCIPGGNGGIGLELVKLLAVICKTIIIIDYEDKCEDIKKLSNVEYHIIDPVKHDNFDLRENPDILFFGTGPIHVKYEEVKNKEIMYNSNVFLRNYCINLRFRHKISFSNVVILKCLGTFAILTSGKFQYRHFHSSTLFDEMTFYTDKRSTYISLMYNINDGFNLHDKYAAERILKCLEGDKSEYFIPTIEEVFEQFDNLPEEVKSTLIEKYPEHHENMLKGKVEPASSSDKENNSDKANLEECVSGVSKVKSESQEIHANEESGEIVLPQLKPDVSLSPKFDNSTSDVQELKETKEENQNQSQLLVVENKDDSKVLQENNTKVNNSNEESAKSNLKEELKKLRAERDALNVKISGLEEDIVKCIESEDRYHLIEKCSQKLVQAFKDKFDDTLSCSQVKKDVMETIYENLGNLSFERLTELNLMSVQEISEFWIFEQRIFSELSPTQQRSIRRMFNMLRGRKSSIENVYNFYKMLKKIYHTSCPDCFIDCFILDVDDYAFDEDGRPYKEIFETLGIEKIKLVIL